MTNSEINKLILSLEPLIMAKAKKASIHSMDYDDVAQELRIKVWKQCNKFNSNKSSNKTYAEHIFKNRIIDLWRRNAFVVLDIAVMTEVLCSCKIDDRSLRSIMRFERKQAKKSTPIRGVTN